MHTLTRHQLTTPVVPRRHFGLGTAISPCSIAAYQNFPGRREECERQAEYYRSLPSQEPSVSTHSTNGIGVEINPVHVVVALALPAAIFLLGRASQS